MLKNRGAALALAALFVLACYGVWLSSRQPPNRHTIEKSNYGAKNSPTYVAAPQSAEDRIADYTWWLSAFTLALVVISSFQICFLTRADKIARIAADAAKESATVAKDSLIIANRPHIAIPAPELFEANESTSAPHICFSLRNGGSIAIIDRVDTVVQATRARGAIGLAKTPVHIPFTINREIEAGQSLGEYHVKLDDFGIRDLQEIKSGDMGLKITFQIISKDMFGNVYDMPPIPFDFDRKKWCFSPSKLLKPENKQQST